MPRHDAKPAPSQGSLPAVFQQAFLTVDLVIFTILDADLKVLLIQRREAPFAGGWALPGGFLRSGEAGAPGEDIEQAARRELAEETGLAPGRIFLRQLGAYGRPDRDPRGRVLSIAHYALLRPDLAPFAAAGGDAANATWHSLVELDRLELAFDHRDMINDAHRRLVEALGAGNIAFELVPPTFTIPELRAVYDVITSKAHDPGNFRRKVQAMVEDGTIEPAPGKRITGGKPAAVYRFVADRTPASAATG
jgi:8-oxo-dGTP diphosphatase